MNWLAWTVFFAFLAWVMWDGMKRTAESNTLEEYYAGGRRIPWWAAGLSVMATQASAITVIGTTGEGHDGGLAFVQFYFGLPFAMIALCVLLVPIYRRLPILTAYQYLETRFNPATRALGSLVFLASRCLALGVVITAPAVVMSAMLKLPLDTTIVMVGALTTLYTMFGGVSAVVWTDVKQMSVILVGLFACFAVLAVKVFGEIGVVGALKAAGAAGKLNAMDVVPPSLDFVPRAASHLPEGVADTGAKTFWEYKYTLWSGLIGGFFLQLAYFGCDQSQVQRILTNKDANASRRALLISAFAKVPMQFFVLAIGVLLWLFHCLHEEPLLYRPDDRARAEASDPAVVADLQARHDAAWAVRKEAVQEIAGFPDDLSAHPDVVRRYRAAVKDLNAVRTEAATRFGSNHKQEDQNYVFPEWILHNLHPLLLGLIVAAIFAAAMSSVDSVLNSLSAATVVDFYKRFVRTAGTERDYVIAGRVTTMLWGAVATGTAIVMVTGSSLIEKVNRVGSFFYGSLLGVFLLGLFAPRVRGYAGFVGLAGGMATVLVVDATLRIEYLWYNVIGAIGVFAFALLWSFLVRVFHSRGSGDPASQAAP
ncbi:MAG: sodium:solute symporter [Planctomycetota bacterium]